MYIVDVQVSLDLWQISIFMIHIIYIQIEISLGVTGMHKKPKQDILWHL